jgi:S1-C subfamily serine protease
MNARSILAFAVIAVVCGGLAGLLVAIIDDDDNGVTAQTSPATTVSDGATPASIYSADAPSVVTITDSATTTAQQSPFLPPTKQKVEQLGSGFVIDSRGDIVTNDHVVAGASDIRVSFANGRSYNAQVVGNDPATDLAVLRVNAPRSQLHPLSFESSSGLQPGDPVYAIGNPFGLSRSMTAGIVSAVGRDIQAPDGRTIPNAIQTDAAINHGNSGGPLIDGAGRVVGVTSQIQGGTVNANVGVGFAVPSNTARTVSQQLIAHGSAAHAWLGVQAADSAHGVAVAKVSAGSPAAKAGLVGGDKDVIVAVDGRDINTASSLAEAVAAHKPGDDISLRVLESGKTRNVSVTLGNLPANA